MSKVVVETEVHLLSHENETFVVVKDVVVASSILVRFS